ncbi:MAG TPA: signal recognition particle-docking protein FtsY [Candidatus Polarisedimenticolaceae bacterium]|nr:signal recognition particle-docking protein FtsY [Candidatus Polarisedimenticolaceae bacterium]
MAFASFRKLFSGLTKTREGIAASLRGVFSSAKVDEATLEEMEASLLAADLGPQLTADVLDEVRAGARGGSLDGPALEAALREKLIAELGDTPAPPAPPPGQPRVVFVVGVNGGGKTTTVGKLAARARAEGGGALVVAADTFRAAAIDQLERWAKRSGVEVVRHREGSDPSAVVYDALASARSRGIGTVLVDTAGRLHTKTPLMAELSKMARVAGREVEGAPHETLLVIDATTGQNGLQQAREFTKASPVTGIVLTKLDGTAKGGVALAIRKALSVPIRYVGVGEGVDDLLEFDAPSYVDGLLGRGEGLS